MFVLVVSNEFRSVFSPFLAAGRIDILIGLANLSNKLVGSFSDLGNLRLSPTSLAQIADPAALAA